MGFVGPGDRHGNSGRYREYAWYGDSGAAAQGRRTHTLSLCGARGLAPGGPELGTRPRGLSPDEEA